MFQLLKSSLIVLGIFVVLGLFAICIALAAASYESDTSKDEDQIRFLKEYYRKKGQEKDDKPDETES